MIRLSARLGSIALFFAPGASFACASGAELVDEEADELATAFDAGYRRQDGGGYPHLSDGALVYSGDGGYVYTGDGGYTYLTDGGLEDTGDGGDAPADARDAK